jgi:hypothetical protein
MIYKSEPPQRANVTAALTDTASVSDGVAEAEHNATGEIGQATSILEVAYILSTGNKEHDE